jgi:alpha-D-ribose 1-methylphosphonate 5-triphosphate synthase subunit PhnH
MTSTLSKKHSFDTVFDSQKVFRLVLEAVSNPTRVVNIKEISEKLFGEFPEILTIAMTLLDNEVSFNTCENRLLSDEITSLTLSERKKLHEADFIFVNDPSKIKNVIENAKSGTLADPHKSATIIIRNEEAPEHTAIFSGPGIKNQAEIKITQAVKDAIFFRDSQNYEYPQGIDLIFISSTGDLFALPRLTRLVN